ncbi:hypothetical protein Tco_0533741 [Tanacetum coccineum]
MERKIISSVEKGPLVWPSITEDGVTRLKEYVELTPAEAIQADCDIKAINIILQGLPTKIYALIMTSSEQSNDVNQTETEITSDSNIIPYSQYLSETQQETVQNSNSSAQQDVLILLCLIQIEQYAKDCNVLSGEILFNKCKKMNPLNENISDLKNDLKMEENRNIDREIALEKKIKQLDNIIFKRGQSAQTVPAFRPNSFFHNTSKLKVPKELPNKNGVTSLKELKRYLTGFDLVVKERTTATAITEGTWGTYCVQKVFYQMEQAVEQHRLESRTFEVKMNQVLSENERLLAQAIDNDTL